MEGFDVFVLVVDAVLVFDLYLDCVVIVDCLGVLLVVG